MVLRERAGSEGDFTGKRQTSPRSGCKNHSSAKASLAGSASCEKNNLPRDSSAHFSSKYSTFAPLGCLGFSPRECCGIFRGARQGQCNPGTELLFGNPRLLPDLGRGCCSGFAMRFTSAFRALSVWIWVWIHHGSSCLSFGKPLTLSFTCCLPSQRGDSVCGEALRVPASSLQAAMLLLPPAFPPWHPQNSGVHDATLYLTQRAGVAGEESGVAEGNRRHFVSIQAVS